MKWKDFLVIIGTLKLTENLQSERRDRWTDIFYVLMCTALTFANAYVTTYTKCFFSVFIRKITTDIYSSSFSFTSSPDCFCRKKKHKMNPSNSDEIFFILNFSSRFLVDFHRKSFPSILKIDLKKEEKPNIYFQAKLFVFPLEDSRNQSMFDRFSISFASSLLTSVALSFSALWL